MGVVDMVIVVVYRLCGIDIDETELPVLPRNHSFSQPAVVRIARSIVRRMTSAPHSEECCCHRRSIDMSCATDAVHEDNLYLIYCHPHLEASSDDKV